MTNEMWIIVMTAFLIFDFVGVHRSANNDRPGLAVGYTFLACLVAFALALRVTGYVG